MTRYKFNNPIGRGGMAEVFLSLQEGIGGFEKLVIVKRIFPHYANDERFVQMFLDEARLAATIRHQNCVEIFDIVKDDRGLFIAMEYIAGETLAVLHDTLGSNKADPMPYAIACRVIADVAAGLSAAHTTTNADGVVEPIVHRDVTPSNLIVGFNGITKILDFGIARAEEELAQTDSKTLRGKPGYLSPEQLREEAVDARADLFQLGVVLHESLTGKRLFRAKNSHMAMLSVLEKPIPRPSTIVDNIPEELDDIVMSALARDVSKRVQSAAELHDQLATFLRTLGNPDHNDVATWLKRELPDRQEKRTEIERSVIRELRGETSGSGKRAESASELISSLRDEVTTSETVTVLEIPKLASAETADTPVREPKKSATLLYTVVAVAAAAAVIFWVAGTFTGADSGDGGQRVDPPPAASATPTPAPKPAVPEVPTVAPPSTDATPAVETDKPVVADVKPAPSGGKTGKAKPTANKSSENDGNRPPAGSSPSDKTKPTAGSDKPGPNTDFKDPWSNDKK